MGSTGWIALDITIGVLMTALTVGLMAIAMRMQRNGRTAERDAAVDRRLATVTTLVPERARRAA
jgi:hypothetical protein